MKKIATVLMTLLFSVTLLFSTIFVFFHYHAAVTDIPTIGNIDGGWLTNFLASNFPILIAAILIVLILLLLVLMSLNKIRVFFACCGTAFALNAAFDCVLRYGYAKTVGFLPLEFRSILAGTTGAFSDFLLLTTIGYILLAAASFSIFASVIMAKGEQHEKKA